MSQHKHGSHDSLSPEECERLVLSPPPVAFNPEKLKEFISVNRALSAKRSLHSVNTNESTPVLPRHASIAWSHSEFDSKFKHYESELKSTVVSGGPQESDAKFTHQASIKTAENDTPSSPVTISSKFAEDVSSTQLKSSGPIVRGKSGWKRLLCCVSTHAPFPEDHERTILRPVSSCGESIQLAAETPEVSTKITKSNKFSSLFKRKERSSTSSSPVKLRSVQKSPQIADERLKTPAPALLVTRHNDPTVINDTNHTHSEENGVAGCHLNVDDRISESTNSRDSIRSDDSYLEPVDQANPGEDLLGKPSPDCIGKKCLVLDLDETLVHSSFKPVDNADFIVTVEIENVQHEVSVCKRPHLETFIETVGPLFEVVMFTASLSKYADPVCDRIDPSGHFKHRLFRESCVCFKSNYIKHLSVLGRDIEQICIIDNSPVSFYFHRQNALQIVTWFDDPTDTALLDLIPYLQGLAAAPSVLEYVSRYAPPPSAAIAQPDLSPWLFGAPSLCGNGVGYYDDEEDEEDADVIHDGSHDAQLECQEDGGGFSSPHGIITMAPRSSSEVVTAT